MGKNERSGVEIDSTPWLSGRQIRRSGVSVAYEDHTRPGFSSVCSLYLRLCKGRLVLKTWYAEFKTVIWTDVLAFGLCV